MSSVDLYLKLQHEEKVLKKRLYTIKQQQNELSRKGLERLRS